ncbi:MAG: winged helix-turn-helix domain-containing protein [Sulfolobales archaeon]
MSAEERVLSYLRVNPGATPREIADALGMSLTSVRIAINRLRELGQVIRSSRGGYVVRVSQDAVFNDYVHSTTQHPVSNDLLKIIDELVSKVSSLESRIERLESEVRLIKKSLPKMPTKRSVSGDVDKFLSTLRLRGVMSVDEVRGLTLERPLDDYVSSGKVVIVGDLVVCPDFLNSFKSKFPIKVSDINSLSSEEVKLLEALVRTNQVYLFSGVEYRILD